MNVNDLFVEAIAARKLRTALTALADKLNASDAGYQQVLEAKAAVAEIDDATEREITKLSRLLLNNNISIKSIVAAVPESVLHFVALTVSSNDLESTIALLETVGYHPEPRYDPKLWERYKLCFDNHTFLSDDEQGFRLQLHWDKPNGLMARIPTRLRPRIEDLAAVALPVSLISLYPLVRVARYLFGHRQKSAGSLGPFLGTPNGLIPDLLKLSGLQDGQYIVDLGCGDGRILLNAATSFNCYAAGYETDPALITIAREAIRNKDQPGLAERVTLHMMDARHADVSQADVVFLFLPMSVLDTLVPLLLRKMKAGAVLLAHEQKRISSNITRPEEQHALIHRDGITVVHKWCAR